MPYISLEEVKDHLRVDINDEDRYIEGLIEAAEASLGHNLGITLENLLLSGSLSDLPADLKHAEKLLVSQWFENREPVNYRNLMARALPYSLDYLIYPHKYWTIK